MEKAQSPYVPDQTKSLQYHVIARPQCHLVQEDGSGK